ncbi:hypothetical protein ACQKP0_12110 [Heyndrickxia sp. NPDC080065]|uniref:hypothetical protein n=1 Tax=Heyndrickxia sp. NPDC080065 TaxID=3390568 RepID=UPI003D02055C
MFQYNIITIDDSEEFTLIAFYRRILLVTISWDNLIQLVFQLSPLPIERIGF